MRLAATRCRLHLTLLLCVSATLLVFCSNAWAEPPVKLFVEDHYGAKVNATTGGNYCNVSSGDTCQAGLVSTIPGGFGEFSPDGVAVDNDPTSPGYGNIFLADKVNQRVQELTPSGEFVLMFGEDVNETTGGNVCTETEIVKAGVKCKAGVASSEAGGFSAVSAVAVDPVSGNIYVSEDQSEDQRVDEFTEAGVFVLMIGGEVNETKDGALGASEAEKNLCTAASKDVCKAGVSAEEGHGAFNLAGTGGELAAGGPSDLLYVGDKHRVQEFSPPGTWVHALSLTAISAEQLASVSALALNQANGDLYLTYFNNGGPGANVVHEYDASDGTIGEFAIPARESGYHVTLQGVALDSSGRLAAIAVEEPNLINGNLDKYSGLLLTSTTGRRITRFEIPPGPISSSGTASDIRSLAFNVAGAGAGEEMYAGSPHRNESLGYVPKAVAEIITGSPVCAEEAERESSVVFGCELTGQVNPENVAGTEAWFAWGSEKGLPTGPGTRETARQSFTTGGSPVAMTPVAAKGLAPNERLYDQLAGYDALNRAPEEPLTGEEAAVVTPLASPHVVGAPSASFVKPFSAVMFAEVNPENAQTEYFFEYAPGEGLAECPGGVRHEVCPTVGVTPVGESSLYGALATTLEARGLTPGTTYRYRLAAESENLDHTARRSSLEAGADPEHEGSFTTPTAPAPTPPASTGSSGPGPFTTMGEPEALSVPAVLAQVAVPGIAFPVEEGKKSVRAVRCKRGYARDKRGLCVKVKSKKKTKKAGGKASRAMRSKHTRRKG